MERFRTSHRFATVVMLVCWTLLPGCATRQVVPIECTPERVEIYVDGRMLADDPELLSLSTDEPHKVFIKAPGFEPQLYVLEPRTGPDGVPRLHPENVCVELVPLGQGRGLEIGIDDEVPPAAMP